MSRGFVFFVLAFFILIGYVESKNVYHPDTTKSQTFRASTSELTANYWIESSQATLKSKLGSIENRNRAKNVIFFLGDGMSVATQTAARAYLGQTEGRTGEELSLAFETFPVSGLVKTYCVDAQVADSACTATAYLGGVKNNIKTIGVTANVTLNDCDAQNYPDNQVSSIAQWALDSGLDAGIVTTCKVTDASPAGAYAHIAHRDWEADADLPADVDPERCLDIARQLVYQQPGNLLKVIMGGGRGEFLPLSQPEGRRLDERDLISKWSDDKHDSSDTRYVVDREQLREAFVTDIPDYLLGLFQEDTMAYHLLADDRQPTLEEMTEAAIKVLSKSDNGYFLFVEGGRIDTAHHDNWAKIALDETVEFSKAVALAHELTSPEDTLIIVTADHAHTMTMAGYPTRGNNILSIVNNKMADDGLPMATLSYANGPGHRPDVDGLRADFTKDDSFRENSATFLHPALAPLDSETHGGDDVALFARGPWQHLFTGNYEQALIPHMLAYAMCVGELRHENC